MSCYYRFLFFFFFLLSDLVGVTARPTDFWSQCMSLPLTGILLTMVTSQKPQFFSLFFKSFKPKSRPIGAFFLQVSISITNVVSIVIL